jgi:hypothetical protein
MESRAYSYSCTGWSLSICTAFAAGFGRCGSLVGVTNKLIVSFVTPVHPPAKTSANRATELGIYNIKGQYEPAANQKSAKRD